jgi:hypothetical protein
MRAILAFCLCLAAAGAAFAAGDAPLSDHLVEPAYRLTVIEEAVLGPLWPAPDDERSWAILRAWAAGPDAAVAEPAPAPAPVPWAGAMMAGGLAALVAWRRLAA